MLFDFMERVCDFKNQLSLQITARNEPCVAVASTGIFYFAGISRIICVLASSYSSKGRL